jgi:cell wall-associated NlpC family hydrolase
MLLRTKQILSITIILLSLHFNCLAKSTEVPFHPISSDSTQSVESLILFAKKHLNYPYRSTGSSPKGFDCSGFVRFCFKKLSITLPHSSAAQSNYGSEVDMNNAKPGDLIFFKGQSTKTSRIGHVGIITEVSPSSIQFIHSAFKGGIRYDMLHADYYKKRFVAIRRLID